MKMIDLRSDTVTRPSEAMRAAMAVAEVGDDVYGEDPTVNRLEELAAGMVGTEAALFAASGTQSNLLALMAHCQRGDEYIVGQQAHTYKYEGGGAAVLGSIQPQPLDFEPDGTLALERIAGAIKPDDVHFARTTLVCLENTHNGLALPLAYMEQVAPYCRERRLRLHLDGARVFNAAIKQQVPVTAITRHFDSISVCLSKGLGAPVGSVLCGSQNLIARARRWRKVLGGGMRQAGILAAGGTYALQNNIERLAEDHRHAALLAEGLRRLPDLQIDHGPAQTNMVFVALAPRLAVVLPRFLKERNILVSGGQRLRLVTHLDIERPDIDTVIQAFTEYFACCGIYCTC
ncbi:low-specificity L-threonine aldolase [uncultured Desulfobulbus sp.]|uniref:low-specificity L-threonine aldolase n=1 Tax=uncultured Desulfobulbus sp. TaxID=239745 RepID=UPI0029C73E9D|nr:low-specificity L-threonine aldolase [uncultured Desulfobulbus sp.]